LKARYARAQKPGAVDCCGNDFVSGLIVDRFGVGTIRVRLRFFSQSLSAIAGAFAHIIGDCRPN